MCFIWTEKKDKRQRDICLLLIIRRQAEKEMSTKQVSHFFFDGTYLINTFNRFNSERVWGQTGVQWNTTGEQKNPKIIWNFGYRYDLLEKQCHW